MTVLPVARSRRRRGEADTSRTDTSLRSGGGVAMWDRAMINSVSAAPRTATGGRAGALAFADAAGARLSPWHGLPQVHAWEPSRATFVAEIPEGTTAKLEVDTGAPWTPIRQDTSRDGAPRHYPTPAPFTYGMLPRTYSDPRFVDGLTGASGDGDPLDAIDISGAPVKPGDVAVVRVLGAFALLDDDSTDWKIVVARETALLDVTDLADCMPTLGVGSNWSATGLLRRAMPSGGGAAAAASAETAARRVAAALTFFRTYKGLGPPPPVSIALNGNVLDARAAGLVIAAHAAQWCGLVASISDGGGAHVGAACAREEARLRMARVANAPSYVDAMSGPPSGLWLPRVAVSGAGSSES